MVLFMILFAVYPDGRVAETQARFYSNAEGEFRVVKQPR